MADCRRMVILRHRSPRYFRARRRVPGHRVKAAHRRISGACGDAHRIFTAAQNCSVTAVVSSVTFQPFLSAFSLANLCSI